MTAALKDWQQGIALTCLQHIKGMFLAYKPYAFGRFGVPNEAEIADMIVSKEGHELLADDGTTVVAFLHGKIAKRNSVKQLFPERKLTIQKNDYVIKHLIFPSVLPDATLLKWLASLTTADTLWLETHTEDLEKLKQLHRLGFKDVGVQISASSELKTILCRTTLTIGVPQLKVIDTATLEELSPTFAATPILQDILKELDRYVINGGWANHYSSYNIRQSWSAISLKGYSEDPAFIVKPAEMSKKWKEENASLLQNAVVETSAFLAFPSVHTLLNKLGCETQRIRFMRVRAEDGGLSRHADITDKEAGATVGKIARLHIPIQTNPECLFKAWDLDGTPRSEHLPSGSLWYLDTRKPHAVSNKHGSLDRIHLVVDAVVNAGLEDWIFKKVLFPGTPPYPHSII